MSAQIPCPTCGGMLNVITEPDPTTGSVNAIIEPHEDCEPPRDVEVSRIVVSRLIGDSGDVISVDASDGLSVIEGAGMLTMALDTWMQTDGLASSADDD